MSDHWTYLTPIGIVAICGITILFIIRFWIERQSKQKRTKEKASKEQLPAKV